MNRFGETANEPRAMMAGRLALLGGRIALDLSGQFLSGWKPDGSMVTDVDRAIQVRLCTEIKSIFPQDGILAEEGEVPVTWLPDARDWWVLDPLDGTANFGQGIPGFSVSVGILRDGMPFAGAVYDPTADWLYTACLGHGAWLNGRRLQIQPQPLSARSVVSIRTPYEDQVPSYVLRWLCRHRL
jgi:fructose-1,6-bisphosphatase/inositol monophosphatase family enzyme